MQDHGIKDNNRKTTKWKRQYRYYFEINTRNFLDF